MAAFLKVKLSVAAVAAGMIMVVGCVQAAEPQKAAPTPAAAAPAPAAVAAPAKAEAAPASKASSGADVYQQSPEPLTILQCAQCHDKQFGDLKAAGGKHRFNCRDCHEVIHAYNPLRNNYAEIMPKCSQCHEQPHGAKHVDCLKCHTNPHTPRRVLASEALGGLCQDCHSGPAAQMVEAPSAHAKQACQKCHHDKHGYIPKCFECHKPHFKEQPVEACMTCHKPHKPLQIVFNGENDTVTCNACHDAVYAKWSKSQSKHGKVNCTRCHTAHGKIPECTQCHKPPHPQSLLDKFPRCLDCHLDPHDPPTKKGIMKK